MLPSGRLREARSAMPLLAIVFVLEEHLVGMLKVVNTIRFLGSDTCPNQEHVILDTLHPPAW